MPRFHSPGGRDKMEDIGIATKAELKSSEKKLGATEDRMSAYNTTLRKTSFHALAKIRKNVNWSW